MKVTTRNLLAELMVDALDDHITATALHCLTRAYRADRHTSRSLAVDQLLDPTSGLDREAVLAKLYASPLLAWDLSKQARQVTLADAFAAEWQAITDKLARCSVALQEWSPHIKDTPIQQALKKGALLFNHHLFFEVHEVLETQWMKETGKEKQFLQGLIQIAVAFYHLENANHRGALALLQDGMAKIAPYQPTFLRVELEQFMHRLAACRVEILRLGETGLSQFRSDAIPSMQIAGETAAEF